jgi:hypothetical protein
MATPEGIGKMAGKAVSHCVSQELSHS